MPAPLVVEVEVGGKLPASLRNALISLQIYLLVFHTSPQPFDKDVVHPASPSIHADGDTMGGKKARKSLRGELGALVGIEDLRGLAALERFFKRLDAEGGVQHVGQPEGQHSSARPVHDCCEVAEASCHRQVGHVAHHTCPAWV